MTLIDQYSGAQHKQGMDPAESDGGELDLAPKWVKDLADRRRLNFYDRAAAYIETVARDFLRESVDDPDKRNEWRESADPATFVNRIASAVLGEGASLIVEGADDPLTAAPELPTPPEAPEPSEVPDLNTVRDAAFAAEVEVYKLRSETVVERWLARWQARPALLEQQDWLRTWAGLDGILAKLYEAETEHIVGLGDGVFVVSWAADRRGVDPTVKGRATVQVFDPSVYFPVLADEDLSVFPDRVHLAWDYLRVTDDDGVLLEQPEERVKRITYELVPLAEWPQATSTASKYDPNWQAEGANVCVMTRATWAAEDVAEIDVDQFPIEKAEVDEFVTPDGATTVPLNQYPIGLDFIPVLHMPNTPSSTRHFGRSSIVRLLQLFDELAETDTDAARAARWAGRPPVAISGLSPGDTTIDLSPGRGIRLDDKGEVSIVEMGSNLLALETRIENLLKRISVNGGVPEGLLGRVDASEVPSGLALSLSFTPFVQLINALRLSRGPKYSLLLKMVQRVSLANDDPSLTAVGDGRIRFGSYMPQDLAGAAAVIQQLNESDAVSIDTKVRMAAEAGVPIEDVAEEAAKIRAGDADVAMKISAATGNEKYGAEWLGIQDWEVAGAFDPDGGL